VPFVVVALVWSGAPCGEMATLDADSAATAVRLLYHCDDPAAKTSASMQLQQLQKSVHAWTVADTLLHRKMDMETCYFAAQTMRAKIQVKTKRWQAF